MSGRSTKTLAFFEPRVTKKSYSRRNWHKRAATFRAVKKLCRENVRSFGRRDLCRRRCCRRHDHCRLRFRLRGRRGIQANCLSSTAGLQFTTRTGNAIASTRTHK